MTNLCGYDVTGIDETLVTSETSGGYWQTSPDMLFEDASANNAASMYPFESSDRYIKLRQDFLPASAGTIIEDVGVSDNYIVCTPVMDQALAKNDILKFGTDANCVKQVEYMKVLYVDSNKVGVERGYYETSPREWDASDTHQQDIYKGLSTAIQQVIPKNRLKAGQGMVMIYLPPALIVVLS